MVKQKKFLRALLERVKPEVQLKKNGDYWQLRYDDGMDTIFAEVLGLDRVQDLLFDLIVAHKSLGTSDDDIPSGDLWEADDRVVAEWHKRGDIVRYGDE